MFSPLEFHDFQPQSWGFHFKLRDGSRKTVPCWMRREGCGCVRMCWNLEYVTMFELGHLEKFIYCHQHHDMFPCSGGSQDPSTQLEAWKDSAPGVGAFRDHRFGSCTPEPGWRILGIHFCWKFRCLHWPGRLGRCLWSILGMFHLPHHFGAGPEGGEMENEHRYGWINTCAKDKMKCLISKRQFQNTFPHRMTTRSTVSPRRKKRTTAAVLPLLPNWTDSLLLPSSFASRSKAMWWDLILAVNVSYAQNSIGIYVLLTGEQASRLHTRNGYLSRCPWQTFQRTCHICMQSSSHQSTLRHLQQVLIKDVDGCPVDRTCWIWPHASLPPLAWPVRRGFPSRFSIVEHAPERSFLIHCAHCMLAGKEV